MTVTSRVQSIFLISAFARDIFHITHRFFVNNHTLRRTILGGTCYVGLGDESVAREPIKFHGTRDLDVEYTEPLYFHGTKQSRAPRPPSTTAGG